MINDFSLVPKPTVTTALQLWWKIADAYTGWFTIDKSPVRNGVALKDTLAIVFRGTKPDGPDEFNGYDVIYTDLDTLDGPRKVIRIDQIGDEKRVLRFYPPLTLEIKQDEVIGPYVEDKSLCLFVYYEADDAIYEDVAEQLFFLWDGFAEANPEILTQDAQELATRLRARITETLHATVAQSTPG